ncbi:hypothetical protein HQ520_05650, partial [bacterium]|nr:hypothetical protein [bacterium]
MVAAACFLAGPAMGQVSIMVEAESFQSRGGWQTIYDSAVLGTYYLIVQTNINGTGPVLDAQTAVTLPTAGDYHIWVRARDYDTFPGERRFRIVLDGQEFAEAGDHGYNSWRWQESGVMNLAAGQHILALRDTVRFNGRCDAVILTTATTDPNTWPSSSFSAARRKPDRLALPLPAVYTNDQAPPLPLGSPLATLDNGKVRVTFHEQQDAQGVDRIFRRTELWLDGAWTPVPEASDSEALFLARRTDVIVSHMDFPLWNMPQYPETIDINSTQIEFYQDNENPFTAAQVEQLLPVSVSQLDSGTVEVQYSADSGIPAKGHWALKPEAYDVVCSVSLVADQTAYYSVGMVSAEGIQLADVEFLQMPYLYQFQRLPEHIHMMTNALMSHALSLVQTTPPSQTRSLTFAVAADPSGIAYDWPHLRRAAYGFTLQNPQWEVQPCVFTPVLGNDGSYWNSGEEHRLVWRVVTFPGDWKDALAYISDEVMQVKDYRRPVYASLTDGALNIVDLITDAFHAGWDTEMKGFYDIETREMAKQAAPLAVISAGMLTHDEEFFRTRALPTIEFTLSRNTAWIIRPDATNLEQNRLRVPSTFYSTAYWMGVHELLGELNPWLDEFILPGDQVLFTDYFNESQAWSEKLELYRFRPTPQLLSEIVSEADQFLANRIYARVETPYRYNAFYNSGYYPYWWDLMDLYEVTGDERYAQAAEEGAFHTIAGLWSNPLHPGGPVTVHENGEILGSTNLLWHGPGLFRLGYPIQPGDIVEKQVPGWEVSRIGLGLENPTTYLQTEERLSNIMMCNWAPHLLRVFGKTGREALRTYARNSIIGRFANYPGYYEKDLTDIDKTADYPYVGPDVSNIYYHHIPPHLAFTLDFLFTLAQVRSSGRIDFPWVKQKNYVWFTNHVYGTQPGEIFGETGATPWVERGLVELDTIEADWLAARSEDRFFLILMSQSDEPLTVGPTLDMAKIGLGASPAWRRYDGDTMAPVTGTGIPTSVVLPPKGIVTYSFAANPGDLYPAMPPLDNGHETRTPSGDWGQLHAFRIRAPFGSDALYVCLTRGPLTGTTVTLTLDGHSEVLQNGRYPFEFTVYPWPVQQDMNLEVLLGQHGATAPQTINLTLFGGGAEMEVVSVESTVPGKVEVVFDRQVDGAVAGQTARYAV